MNMNSTFSFKKAELFLECVNHMINKERRVNGEFYLDIALDECILTGHRVFPFKVERYFCWGTPDDLSGYSS